MEIPKVITVYRSVTYNVSNLTEFAEEELSLSDILDIALDNAIEDLSDSRIGVHMTDENGTDIPWEDILNAK